MGLSKNASTLFKGVCISQVRTQDIKEKQQKNFINYLQVSNKKKLFSS